MSLSKIGLLSLLAALPFLLTACSSYKEDVIPPGPGEHEPGPGEVVWSYPISTPFDAKPEPAIDRGRAFIAADRRVRCFDLKSGKLIWETQSFKEVGVIGVDLVHQDENRVYINRAGDVIALNKADGRLSWRTFVPGFVSTSFQDRMGQTSRHLFMGGNGEVVRIAKADGRVDLRIPLDDIPSENGLYIVGDNPTIADDGLLYVAAGTRWIGKSLYMEGRLLVYEPENGKFVWGYAVPPKKVELTGYSDSVYVNREGHGVLVHRGKVFLLTASSVFALDQYTHKPLWEQTITDGWGMSMAVGDGRVFAGTSTGWIYTMDLEAGKILWSIDTPGAVDSMTLLGERLYFGGGGHGQIYVVEAATGRILWHRFPPGYDTDDQDTYLSPLAIGEGYMVDVGPRRIYALKVP